jgi:hypothetical protein
MASPGPKVTLLTLAVVCQAVAGVVPSLASSPLAQST